MSSGLSFGDLPSSLATRGGIRRKVEDSIAESDARATDQLSLQPYPERGNLTEKVQMSECQNLVMGTSVVWWQIDQKSDNDRGGFQNDTP